VNRNVKGTRKDAEAVLSALEAEQAAGKISTARETVAAFLTGWIAEHPRAKPQSRHAWEGIARNHLLPALGHFRLSELSPVHLQAYVAAKGRTHSAATVRQHAAVLHAALAAAVRLELLARNPMERVTLPPVPGTRGTVLAAPEVIRFLEASRGGRYHLPILLSATLGLREGEVLGLAWADLDAKAGLVHCRRTLVQYGRTVTTGPRKGKREGDTLSLPLPPLVAEALPAQRSLLVHLRAAAGGLWQEHDLLCPAEDGRLWHPSAFRMGYYRLLAKHDLPRVRFHDLRHSNVSLLLSAGVPLKTVSARVGHANQAVTARVYSHLLPGDLDLATEVLERLLREEDA
jgi:integrase